MTIRRGAIPALIVGAMVALAVVGSAGPHGLLAALPALLISLALLLGRSAGVDALVDLAAAISVRDRGRRPGSAPLPAHTVDHLPFTLRPLSGGLTRRGPPLARRHLATSLA